MPDYLTTGVQVYLDRGHLEPGETARAQIAMQKWGEVVGVTLADKSFPDRYEKGTLWVVATGSAWAQEIRLRKEDIVRRLNELSEPGLFRDVRVGAGPALGR